MNNDSPRYHMIAVDPDNVRRDLQGFLRPGDRVVSIFPVQAEPKSYPQFSTRPSGGVELRALIELRHPSWALVDAGWVAGEKEGV
jgi:hypothetical protein